MLDLIPADWRAALDDATSSPSFAALSDFVSAARGRRDTEIYPPEEETFAALRLTPLAKVRVVIVGQDPYHGEGEAHGLAFSYLGSTWPPSLKNIIKEWQADLDITGPPASGSLEPWARQGVLLLNTVLTVERDKANSHKKKGWEPFTAAIVNAVTRKQDPVGFLLWGRQAQRVGANVADPHFAIESAHPSGFSVKGFTGTRPFSRVNRGLEDRGRPPIDWRL